MCIIKMYTFPSDGAKYCLLRKEGKTIFRFSRTIGFLMFMLMLIAVPLVPCVLAHGEGDEVSYTIKRGDTLSQIAITHGVGVSTLMRANNLNSTIIYPDQVLVIPGSQAEKNVSSRGQITRDELMLLARAIYAEARGESFEGQVAVGAVIINRLNSPHFPDTIRDVIMQSNGKTYQFSPVSDGSINLTPNDTAIEAARRALEGHDPTGGALFFYNPHLATDQWIRTLPVVTTIGRHAFANKT